MTVLLFLGLSGILVLIDQLIKRWILANVELGQPIPLIENVLHITFSENTGAAFGIFKDQKWFLILYNLVLLSAIIFFMIYNRAKTGRLFTFFCLSLILAGGVGNLIDRFSHGYVVDWIDIEFYPFENFAIFNFADCCIVTGAFLLLFHVAVLEPIFAAKKKKALSQSVECERKGKEGEKEQAG